MTLSPAVVVIEESRILIGVANETAPRAIRTTLCAVAHGVDDVERVVAQRPHLCLGDPSVEFLDLTASPGHCFLDGKLRLALGRLVLAALAETDVDHVEQRHCMLVIPQAWCVHDIFVAAIAFATALGFQGAYVGQPCVAAALRCGLPSAVVVDVGRHTCAATAVIDGQTMLRGRGTAACGLRHVEAELLWRLGGEGEAALTFDDTFAAATWPRDGPPPNDEQMVAWVALAAEELRLACAFVSPQAPSHAKQALTSPPGPTSAFRTARGRIVDVAPNSASECFARFFSGEDGLPKLAFKAKRAVDCELQTVMPVVVCGDGAAVPGLATRLHEELKRLDATFLRMKALITATRYAIWEGAAILCGTPAFDGLWISSAEAAADCDAAVRRKLFS